MFQKRNISRTSCSMHVAINLIVCIILLSDLILTNWELASYIYTITTSDGNSLSYLSNSFAHIEKPVEYPRYQYDGNERCYNNIEGATHRAESARLAFGNCCIQLFHVCRIINWVNDFARGSYSNCIYAVAYIRTGANPTHSCVKFNFEYV